MQGEILWSQNSILFSNSTLSLSFSLESDSQIKWSQQVNCISITTSFLNLIKLSHHNFNPTPPFPFFFSFARQMQIGESTQFGEPEIYSFGNWLKKERQRGKKNSVKKEKKLWQKRNPSKITLSAHRMEFQWSQTSWNSCLIKKVKRKPKKKEGNSNRKSKTRRSFFFES